eukprot:Amastigsp_a517030_23.p3 type:complete len:187 gc:universal Amastigsp_a517030_23:1069-509(-)
MIATEISSGVGVSASAMTYDALYESERNSSRIQTRKRREPVSGISNRSTPVSERIGSGTQRRRSVAVPMHPVQRFASRNEPGRATGEQSFLYATSKIANAIAPIRTSPSPSTLSKGFGDLLEPCVRCAETMMTPTPPTAASSAPVLTNVTRSPRKSTENRYVKQTDELNTTVASETLVSGSPMNHV